MLKIHMDFNKIMKILDNENIDRTTFVLSLMFGFISIMILILTKRMEWLSSVIFAFMTAFQSYRLIYKETH